MSQKQRVTILGATGSIGKSTLDVIRHQQERFDVFALTANSSVQELAAQCIEFNPRFAVLANESDRDALVELLSDSGCNSDVMCGRNALKEVAQAPEVDIVMAAIVGAAGLEPTLAGVNAGKRVLLANKEALVMSGGLFQNAVKKNAATLLPIDSEHNAIFQCLPERYESLSKSGIQKILLTGSGGPFRETPIEQLKSVTPDQACAHPNWSMGRKISVDSATMMNKGLEFIEARWLFNAECKDIEVVVHPQSIVHSMVQYSDGSVLAQMGRPDMRTPIAHCLSWPERMESGVAPLDFSSIGSLTFEAPDFDRFPCLALALDASREAGDCPAGLNAANEVAVEAFLAGGIKFTDIAKVIAEVMESWQTAEPEDIDAVIDADKKARRAAEAVIKTIK